jgi:hypothetical protein
VDLRSARGGLHTTGLKDRRRLGPPLARGALLGEQLFDSLTSMRLTATARLKDDTTAESTSWAVEGDTYDDALVRARSEVPAGQILLFVRVER